MATVACLHSPVHPSLIIHLFARPSLVPLPPTSPSLLPSSLSSTLTPGFIPPSSAPPPTYPLTHPPTSSSPHPSLIPSLTCCVEGLLHAVPVMHINVQVQHTPGPQAGTQRITQIRDEVVMARFVTSFCWGFTENLATPTLCLGREHL